MFIARATKFELGTWLEKKFYANDNEWSGSCRSNHKIQQFALGCNGKKSFIFVQKVLILKPFQCTYVPSLRLDFCERKFLCRNNSKAGSFCYNLNF